MGYLMINIANVASKTLQNVEEKPTKTAVSLFTKKLFVMMHGAYGNLFLSKFATGEKIEEKGPDEGKDRGVMVAMSIWDHALRKFSSDVVYDAIQCAQQAHPHFPPNLPQFEAICRSLVPVKIYVAEQPAIRFSAPDEKLLPPVSFEAKNDHKDWARRILAKHEAGYKLSYFSIKSAKEALGK